VTNRNVWDYSTLWISCQTCSTPTTSAPKKWTFSQLYQVGWVVKEVLHTWSRCNYVTYHWLHNLTLCFLLFPLGSVWLKSQVERIRSVPVLLLFGYKETRTEWLQLENILLRCRTIPLQKINRTEPLRSHPALTVTLRSVHSATKQKTEPLRSRLPNTEQSGSVPKIRDGTAPFYLTPQPNTALHVGWSRHGDYPLVAATAPCRLLPLASHVPVAALPMDG
jgi:hypothetical protein